MTTTTETYKVELIIKTASKGRNWPTSLKKYMTELLGGKENYLSWDEAIDLLNKELAKPEVQEMARRDAKVYEARKLIRSLYKGLSLKEAQVLAEAFYDEADYRESYNITVDHGYFIELCNNNGISPFLLAI